MKDFSEKWNNLVISYSAGNTCRHIGQLCRPPPASLVPHLCTSSSFFCSISFCRGALSFTQYVRSCLLTGKLPLPPSSLLAFKDPSFRISWEGLCLLWGNSPPTGLLHGEKLCLVSLTESGVCEVLGEGWGGSVKVVTSLLRSGHPCSSNHSGTGL